MPSFILLFFREGRIRTHVESVEETTKLLHVFESVREGTVSLPSTPETETNKLEWQKEEPPHDAGLVAAALLTEFDD